MRRLRPEWSKKNAIKWKASLKKDFFCHILFSPVLPKVFCSPKIADAQRCINYRCWRFTTINRFCPSKVGKKQVGTWLITADNYHWYWKEAKWTLAIVNNCDILPWKLLEFPSIPCVQEENIFQNLTRDWKLRYTHDFYQNDSNFNFKPKGKLDYAGTDHDFYNHYFYLHFHYCITLLFLEGEWGGVGMRRCGLEGFHLFKNKLYLHCYKLESPSCLLKAQNNNKENYKHRWNPQWTKKKVYCPKKRWNIWPHIRYN